MLYGERMRHARFAVLLLTLCTACSLLNWRWNKKPVQPSDKLWSEADQAMKDEAYDIAIQNYKALLEQYPFDPNAEEAELKIAEAYYDAGRYPEAIAAFGDFERMHPTSENLALIEYRRGMAYLAQHRSSDRDQQAIKNAQDSFRNVVDRYPDTPWASRAALRMRECREELAEHDAGIATFYLQRGSLRAAESRLRGLLTDYPDTTATAEALDRFAKLYSKREEPEEANLALATLARYHPDNPLGRDARQQLGTLDPAAGGDPLPMLVAHIDALRTQADREKVPAAVSAYSDRPGQAGGRGY
jgi:outer membrane protein assembly factor BamD